MGVVGTSGDVLCCHYFGQTNPKLIVKLRCTWKEAWSLLSDIRLSRLWFRIVNADLDFYTGGTVWQSAHAGSPNSYTMCSCFGGDIVIASWGSDEVIYTPPHLYKPRQFGFEYYYFCPSYFCCMLCASLTLHIFDPQACKPSRRSPSTTLRSIERLHSERMANITTNIPWLKLNDGTSMPMLGYGTGTAWFKKGEESKLDQPVIDAVKVAIKLEYTHLDGAESEYLAIKLRVGEMN